MNYITHLFYQLNQAKFESAFQNLHNPSTNSIYIIKNFKIPLKKVAIELNEEIVDKKKLNKISLKTNDKIEIVHFIGGG